MTTPLEEALEKIDLREYMRQSGAELIREHKLYWTFRCPHHGGTSLQVWEDHAYCFGSCGRGWSTFQMILEHSSSYEDAVNRAMTLGKMSLPVTRPVNNKSSPVVDYRPIALRLADQFDVALPYMTKRAIDGKVALSHIVGAQEDYDYSYQFLGGNRTTFRCRRYSLPNTFGETVRSINYRRDETQAKAIYANMDSRLFNAIQDDYKRRCEQSNPPRPYAELDEGKMIDTILGAKYLRSGPMKIFNLDLLCKKHGNSITYNSMTYCLIVCEGKEIDTMAYVSAGYNAVGVPHKGGMNMKDAFQNVTQLYIIGDNDEAGHNKTQWVKQELGRGNVIFPPKDYKDGNEVAVDGQLGRWLTKYGVEPHLVGA